MDIIKVLKDWIAAVDKGEAFVRSYAESHGVGMASHEKEFTVSFCPLEQSNSLQRELDKAAHESAGETMRLELNDGTAIEFEAHNIRIVKDKE